MKRSPRFVCGLAFAVVAGAVPSGIAAQTRITEDAVIHAVRLAVHPSGQSSPRNMSDWADVMALTHGSRIRVTLDGQSMAQFTFQSATADGLLMTINRQELNVLRERVVEVSSAEGASRGHHTLLGFLIGGAGGAIAAIVHCHGMGAGCLEGSPGDFYPGAGLGALIGAAIPVAPWRLVYSRVGR